MIRTPTAVAAIFVICAGRAEAHSFQSGVGHYQTFVEGTRVVLAYPATLLPLLALGILLSLWHPEGPLRAWPSFLAGLVAGIPLAALDGAWMLPAVLAAGAVTAVLAALLPRHQRAEALAVSFVIGAMAVMVSLEGHGLFQLPLALHAGILLAVILAPVCMAALARIAMERYPAPWMRILWRIAASWLAAILILHLAFTLTTPS